MLPGDVDGVADMIEVTMAQDDMGDARDGAVDIAFEMRIPGQERVDQDDRRAGVDPECGMAEIGDLHGGSLRSDRRPHLCSVGGVRHSAC